MKSNYYFLYAVAFFFVAFSVACDKNEDVPPTGGKWLPSLVVCTTLAPTSVPDCQPSVKTCSFEYDDRNRIVRIHTTSVLYGQVQNMEITVTLAYEEDKITATTTRTDIPEFKYKQEFVSLGNEIRIGDAPLYNERYKIKLDGNGRALRYNRLPQGVGNYFIGFTYSEAGNTESMTWCPVASDDRTETYMLACDSLNGVFRHVQTPAWYLATQLECGGIEYLNLVNNCIRSAVAGHTVYEYENTYNAAGYPVKIVRHPVGIDGAEQLEYEIEYRAAR